MNRGCCTLIAVTTSGTKPLGQVIGERVQQLREQRRWSQRELALRLGEVLQGPPAWDDHTTVNLIEKGKRRVLAAELLALAHVLGVDAAALVTEPGGASEVDLGRGPIPIRMGDDASQTGELSRQTAFMVAKATMLDNAQQEAASAAEVADGLASDLRKLSQDIDRAMQLANIVVVSHTSDSTPIEKRRG